MAAGEAAAAASVSPGAAAAARIGAAAASGSGPVLDEPDLSAVHLGAVQLLQSSLHVRVQPELDHAFVPAAFVGVGVRHLARLPHVVLHTGSGRSVAALLALEVKGQGGLTFRSCQLQRLERFSTMRR